MTQVRSVIPISPRFARTLVSVPTTFITSDLSTVNSMDRQDDSFDDMPSLVPIDPEERSSNPSRHLPNRHPHIEDLLDMLTESAFTFPPPEAHLDLGEDRMQSPEHTSVPTSVPTTSHDRGAATSPQAPRVMPAARSNIDIGSLVTFGLSGLLQQSDDEEISSDNEDLPPLIPITTLSPATNHVNGAPQSRNNTHPAANNRRNEDEDPPPLLTPSGSEAEDSDSDLDFATLGETPSPESGIPPLPPYPDPRFDPVGFAEFLVDSVRVPPGSTEPVVQPRGSDSVFSLIRLLTSAVAPIATMGSGESSSDSNPVKAKILLRSATVLDGDALKRYQRLHNNGEDANCPICTDGFSEDEGVAHAEWSKAAVDNRGSSTEETSSEEPKPFVAALPCNHVFHSGCLFPWLCRNSTCPLCRFKLDPNYQAVIEARRIRDRNRSAQRRQNTTNGSANTTATALASMPPPSNDATGTPRTRPRASSMSSLLRNRPEPPSTVNSEVTNSGIPEPASRPRVAEVPVLDQSATSPTFTGPSITAGLDSIHSAIGGLTALQEDLRILRQEQELLREAQRRRGMQVDAQTPNSPFQATYYPPKGPRTFEEMLIARETEDGLRCQHCRKWLSGDVKEIIGLDFKIQENEVCRGCLNVDSLD
ncbi:hypothetical protein FRC02_011299 [Tulasnella sp. 418]|nr:hypothetical protein FRC02_011299 [Tulasnella sp. 418]